MKNSNKFQCLPTFKDFLKGNLITKINFKMTWQQRPKTSGSLIITAHRNNSQCTTMEATTTRDNNGLHMIHFV